MSACAALVLLMMMAMAAAQPAARAASSAKGKSPRPNQQSRIYQEGDKWMEVTTGSLATAPEVTVKVLGGSLAVEGGTQREITYTLKKWSRSANETEARRQLQRYRLVATTSAKAAVIHVGGRGSAQNTIGSELTIHVPRSTGAVRIFTRGGNDAVSGIGGRVEIVAGTGNLRLDDIGGDIAASTMGGSVEVGTAGGNLTLKTGGGSVEINAVNGQIIAHSGGGDIKIGSGGRNVIAETAGGTIHVKHCGGEFRANTGGGGIRLASAKGTVVANTSGGTIELYGLTRGARVSSGGGRIVAEFLASSAFSASSLQTPAGDIVVYLAPGLKATVKAAIDLANGHRIRSDFSQIKVSDEGGRYVPKALYAEGNLNGGGPLLQVRTSNGDIQFRRLQGE